MRVWARWWTPKAQFETFGLIPTVDKPLRSL